MTPVQSPAQEPTSSHVVACFYCKALFDAVEAAWCRCLTSHRSFVCPGCLRCFCKAPQSYKQGFWQRAPGILWQRQTAQRRPAEDLPPNPDVTAVRRPLVLIVEDERDVRQIAYAAVTHLGYHAIVACDGEQGILVARQYRPELILTDAFMPKLDGRQMCRQLKAEPETSSAKVVVMSSLYTAARYKYEAFKEYQADDYLSKPLELETLKALLLKHLGSPPEAEAAR
jgi:CheY-like chemotaxis protein